MVMVVVEGGGGMQVSCSIRHLIPSLSLSGHLSATPSPPSGGQKQHYTHTSSVDIWQSGSADLWACVPHHSEITITCFQHIMNELKGNRYKKLIGIWPSSWAIFFLGGHFLGWNCRFYTENSQHPSQTIINIDLKKLLILVH